MKFPNIAGASAGAGLSTEDRKWVKLAQRLSVPTQSAEHPEAEPQRAPRADQDTFEAPRAPKKR